MPDVVERNCVTCKWRGLDDSGIEVCRSPLICFTSDLINWEPSNKHTERVMPNTDLNGIDQHAPGAKCDMGKVRVGLMFKGFARALLSVAEVVTYGAKKYTPMGWVQVPDAFDRYDDAKGRHMLEGYITDKDEESDLLHLQHEAWNALAKLELYLRGKDEQ